MSEVALYSRNPGVAPPFRARAQRRLQTCSSREEGGVAVGAANVPPSSPPSPPDSFAPFWYKTYQQEHSQLPRELSNMLENIAQHEILCSVKKNKGGGKPCFFSRF